MRIALDATPLSLSSGGQRRYVEELSHALAANFPDDQIWLASDQPFAHDRAQRVLAPEGSWLDRRWWLAGLPRALRREHIDVFHGANFEVPYTGRCPAVLSLLDLSPWMNPAWHGGAARVRRRTPWLLRTGRARMVLTLTEAVRRQAIDRFGLAPHRVVAVPLAAGPLFRPVPVAAAKPYFLFVGTLEPRKNVAMLMAAWRALGEGSPDLVLAGRCRADFTPPAPEPGLRWLGEVPDAQLPELYSGCLACVYPSHYEGFGLPVLEAMQCGAPVIAAREPSLQEVAGGAALWISSEAELAGTLRAVAAGAELRRKHSELSIERARQFSWSRTARLTREVYAEAIRRTG